MENCPESQRSVDNPKNGPQKRSKPLCGLAGRKRCPGPRSSLLDALTGLLAELEAFLARRIGVVQLLARDEEPAQRPPEAPDGIFRVLVVLSDVGFRLCHGTSSRLHRKHPARVRSLLGDPGATPRAAVGRSGCNRGLRGRQDQDPRSGRVVQLRPGQLDLLQLAEHLCAEVVNGALVAGVVRVRSELAIQLLPGEPLWSTKREGAVHQPQVQVEGPTASV